MSLSKCLQKKEDDFQRRISHLQKELEGKSWQAWLIEDPLDLYYLTGESFSVGSLWIAQEKVLLLVDQRYLEKAKQTLQIPVSLKSDEASSQFLSQNAVQKVAFDANKTTVSRLHEMEKKNKLEWIPFCSITVERRKVKSVLELELIRKSAEILWEGYLYIKTILKEGILEKEVAKKFEVFCLQKGADGLSFQPIIAFGENSALPHHRAGDRALKRGDVVLIDIGVFFQKYASDMTRVLFFKEVDPFLLRWLDLTKLAQKAAMNLCAPGVKVSELDLAARSIFKQEGVESYFVHSLGHGVGLEVHEDPRIRFDQENLLKTGMVITLEPGLYLPGKGGVRYEDMVVITDTGYENLFPLDEAFII